MSDREAFDFWYAVNNTEVIRLPVGKLETFGSSVVNYHLVSELMDEVNKVRVREGKIEAFRPEIITPQEYADQVLEGFGGEAAKYMDWLQSHQKDLYILKYGFKIRKQDVTDHIVSESLAVVLDRVKSELEEKDDPLSALLAGVETPWEVCLLKLMVEVVQGSFTKHVHDLRRDPRGSRHEIEKAFLAASRDAARIGALSDLLHQHNLFEEYEDRFFALVRASK